MSRRFPKTSTKIFTDIYDDEEKFLLDYNTCKFPTTITTDNATILYYLLYSTYGNSSIANYDVNQFKYKLFSIVWKYGPTWEEKLNIQKTLREMSAADLVDDGRIKDTYNEQFSSSGTGKDTTNNTGHQDFEYTGSEESITNHALNPETAPATNAYDALGYINAQDANKTSFSNDRKDVRTDVLKQVTDHEHLEGQSHGGDVTKDITAGKLKGYERLLALLETDVTTEFVNRFKICFKQFALPGYGYYYANEEDDE